MKLNRYIGLNYKNLFNPEADFHPASVRGAARHGWRLVAIRADQFLQPG